MHAMDLADINGDGLKDIVTGKRFWAHGPHGDVEPKAPAVLYWFELRATSRTAPVHSAQDRRRLGRRHAGDSRRSQRRRHPRHHRRQQEGTFIHSQASRGSRLTASGSYARATSPSRSVFRSFNPEPTATATRYAVAVGSGLNEIEELIGPERKQPTLTRPGPPPSMTEWTGLRINVAQS